MKQLVFIALLLLHLAYAQHPECKNIKSDDGKSVYDLSWFVKQGAHPSIHGTDPGGVYLYQFQICGAGFDCGLTACSGAGKKAGACQSWGNFMDLQSEACTGNSIPTSIKGLDGGKGVTFEYNGGDQYQNNPRVTQINLVCDKAQDGWGTVVFDDSKQRDLLFVVTVTSTHACPGGGPAGDDEGLGGWIFIIILVCFAVVYLVAGVIFNKVRGGASGVELVPNFAFWANLPGLIRDGALFIVRGGGGSYTQV